MEVFVVVSQFRTPNLLPSSDPLGMVLRIEAMDLQLEHNVFSYSLLL